MIRPALVSGCVTWVVYPRMPIPQELFRMGR